MDTRERFQRIEALFRAACALDGDERMRFLDAECKDSGVRQEIEALLEEDASPLIEDPTSLSLAGGLSVEEILDTAPEIDGFRIIRTLGAGGMGVVYEAEQERPSRRVALKVLRAGHASAERIRRFQLEAEFLARLRHPSIGQIYEAGSAKDGRPFFAMELVEGIPITSYVGRERLSTRARIELFLRVTDGVVHAHQHGVIHRDIKPANILVEAGGRVKVLDFGIGRAIEAEAGATQYTTTGQLVGTLAYMSPEQAAGDPREIDIRTDVYSLGVVLYELLSGRRPQAIDQLALEDALRMVRTGDVTRLSSLDRTLRGDLETIALRALEKDKARRYQSVGELGDDLRRFLRNEPVVARPPSTIYQMRKFAARHRPLVIGAGAVVGALLIGLIGVSIALGQARRAEARARASLAQTQEALTRADQQSRIAQAAKEFLTNDLLAAANPDAQGPDTPVREVLRAASDRIDHQQDMDPLFRSEILVSLGKTMLGVGEYDRAKHHLEDAISIRREVLGDDDLLTVDAMKDLDTVLVQLGNHTADRLPTVRHVFEVRKAKLGEDDPQTIVSWNDYALALEDAGRMDESRREFEGALEAARRVEGEESARVATILHNLGWQYDDAGETDKAEASLKEAFRIRKKVLGPRASRTLLSENSLASFYWAQDRVDEAEPLAREAYQARLEILGERHPHTINSMDNLGTLYLKMGKLDRALELSGRALELREEIQGPNHRQTLTTMNNVAAIRRTAGEYPEAEALYAEAYKRAKSVEGEEMIAGWVRRSQGDVLWKLGRNDEAEAAMRDAIEILSASVGPDNSRTSLARDLLAEFLDDQGRGDEAAAVRSSVDRRSETSN